MIIKPIPSGKHTKNYGQSPFYSWVNPLYLAIFNSYVTNYHRVMAHSFHTFDYIPVVPEKIPMVSSVFHYSSILLCYHYKFKIPLCHHYIYIIYIYITIIYQFNSSSLFFPSTLMIAISHHIPGVKHQHR